MVLPPRLQRRAVRAAPKGVQKFILDYEQVTDKKAFLIECVDFFYDINKKGKRRYMTKEEFLKKIYEMKV